MRDRRCIVQFLHPGPEHWPDEADSKRWNMGDHARKFLRSDGEMIVDGTRRREALVFWGEWEPESQIVQRYSNRVAHCPHFLYEPHYVPPPNRNDWLQNTDPFVFGDRFRYTGCLQHQKSGRPTQMRYLMEGSLILFGSCVDSAFVLDTVFVIAGWIDHQREDYSEQLAEEPEVYWHATIDRWYAGKLPSGQSHRLYYGATADNPVGGMFSFFPCLRERDAPNGFARPVIDVADITNPRKNQNTKIRYDVSVEESKRVWDEVAAQVAEQQRSLGVSVEMPPKRAS